MSRLRVLWSRVLEDGTRVQVVQGPGKKQIEIVDEWGAERTTDGPGECVRFEVRTMADRHSLEMAIIELLEAPT